MKKILLLSGLIFSAALTVNAAEVALPPSLGGIQSTDFQMKLMDQQRFRQEEYNEFKDMDEQKAEKNKKLELEEKYQNQQQTKTIKYTPDVKLIRENGQLKLTPVTGN